MFGSPLPLGTRGSEGSKGYVILGVWVCTTFVGAKARGQGEHEEVRGARGARGQVGSRGMLY